MVTRKFIFFAAVAALLLSCTKEEKDRILTEKFLELTEYHMEFSFG